MHCISHKRSYLLKPLGQKCIEIVVEQKLEKKILSNCEDWTSVELTSYGGGTMVKAGVYWDVRECVHVVFVNGCL